MMRPPLGYIMMKQKQDGSWVVSYPDPSFIPCEPACNTKHKHTWEQPWIATNYQPGEYESSIAWAQELAEGREIKVVEYMTPIEKRIQTLKERKGETEA